MRTWVAAEQHWLTLERLPAYAPELNPVELLWSAIKIRELANLAGEHLADVADAAERGIHRVCSDEQLPWSFLTHTRLTIHPETPPSRVPRWSGLEPVSGPGRRRGSVACGWARTQRCPRCPFGWVVVGAVAGAEP